MLKDLEKSVLSKAQEKREANELAKLCGVPLSSVMSAVESLREKGFAASEVHASLEYALTEEGMEMLARTLPEQRLARALEKTQTAAIQELKESLASKTLVEGGLSPEEFGIALQWAKALGLVEIRPGKLVLLSLSPTSHDLLLEKIGQGTSEPKLSEAEKKTLSELEKRTLAKRIVSKKVFVQATPSGLNALKEERGEVITQLTPQMLKARAWEGKKFVPYDVPALFSVPLALGKKHAYKQLLLEIKQKLVGMGFVEAHGPLVEMEFWNMDALFMAQDHPAREIHDVFQVEDPARGEILEKKLLEQVRIAHEKGLAGSKGWRYRWDAEVSARLVLRSHTTPVSARSLAKGIKPPQRIFCVGRVFRPDEIDWKHFIEFNQCEGIVMDESMSFRELLGYLKEFALEVFGAKEVRFAPSYFPFTEPSVELMAKIPGKGWAEVGGAGMFRPEMLAALGVDVPVLAWGLGIDRLAMIKLGLKDIRDLFTQDLKALRA
ncbi:phenylalanine--tRNA ligase subunit alpha [Candidatus Micrarchaeota archaeon]|nr:phenylalanine--tRNA ligase subunit alpha [Candidatus Micrarchaeota archaeon]